MSLIDINNDGLDDIIIAYYVSGVNTSPAYEVKGTFLNNNNGWEEVDWEFPGLLANCNPYYIPQQCDSKGIQIIDVNGDGLVDALKPTGNGIGIYLNNGQGWDSEPSDTWQAPVMGESWQHGAQRFTDLNGDGLVDILSSYYETQTEEEFKNVYINTGSGWQENTSWTIPEIFVDHNYGSGRFFDNGVRLMDFNNDGAVDILKAECNGGYWGCNMDRSAFLGYDTQANLVSTINNGYGSVTSLDYQMSGRYFDDLGNFKNPDLPFNMATVKQIITTDGSGNNLITTYDYQDGGFYYDEDYTLNEFTGFGIVTTQTEDQIVKSYYHQGGGIDGYELGEFEDSIYKKGRVYRGEVLKEVNGQYEILSQKLNKWNQEDLGDGRYFVYLENDLGYTFEDGVLVNRSERGRSLPQGNNQSLVELLEKQVFVPENEP